MNLAVKEWRLVGVMLLVLAVLFVVDIVTPRVFTQPCAVCHSCLDRGSITSCLDAVGDSRGWVGSNCGWNDLETNHAWSSSMDDMGEPGIYDYRAVGLGLVRMETATG